MPAHVPTRIRFRGSVQGRPINIRYRDMDHQRDTARLFHGWRQGWVGVTLALLTVAGLGATCSALTFNADRCNYFQNGNAGNANINFFVLVGQGQDPLITGGADDPFGCAYNLLCDDQQQRVSEEEFRSTFGAAISRLLTADTTAGPSVYVDRGLDRQHSSSETKDRDVMSTWIDVEATWFEHIDERTIVIGSGVEEHWRVDLVREDGDWQLCEFTPIT